LTYAIDVLTPKIPSFVRAWAVARLTDFSNVKLENEPLSTRMSFVRILRYRSLPHTKICKPLMPEDLHMEVTTALESRTTNGRFLKNKNSFIYRSLNTCGILKYVAKRKAIIKRLKFGNFL
jgi:hypothetical protein